MNPFDLALLMKQFINVITDKAKSAELRNKELVLGKRLGGGRESEVFQSSWLGVQVAIKYFLDEEPDENQENQENPSASSKSKEKFKGFSNEVAILMSLGHKNIVTFMGFGAPQFIVMEYMPKGSLFHILGSKIALDKDLKHRLILDIISGMSYLHNGDPYIIHQDMKSLNLLVDDHWNVKISDFGISRQRYSKKEISNEQESNSHGSTLQWLAPEYIKQDLIPLKEMDIYAFG